MIRTQNPLDKFNSISREFFLNQRNLEFKSNFKSDFKSISNMALKYQEEF